MNRKLMLAGVAITALLGSLPSLAQARAYPTYNPASLITGQTNLDGRHRGCLWVQPKGGDYSESGADIDAPSGVAQACVQAVTLFDASGGALGQPGGMYVQGPVAANTAIAGNPLPGGCDFNTTPPTYTTGTRAATQCDNRGAQYVVIKSNGGTSVAGVVATNADDVPVSTVGLATGSFGFLFDGSTWDRARSVQGATAGDGTGVQPIAAMPVTSVNAGITPVVTSAVAGSVVLKASAGNLYAVDITTGGSAGYLLVFNATSAPADGAVTPVICMPVAANTGMKYTNNIPDVFSTGITAVFSTTGCFTKTISATAHIKGSAK